MRVHVFSRDRHQWPKPLNHMDGRVCPDCRATVHGDDAQRDHRRHHEREHEYRLQVNELLALLAERSGLTVVMPGESGQWPDTDDVPDDHHELTA